MSLGVPSFPFLPLPIFPRNPKLRDQNVEVFRVNPFKIYTEKGLSQHNSHFLPLFPFSQNSQYRMSTVLPLRLKQRNRIRVHIIIITINRHRRPIQ